ncbi:MAG TPA: redoxin domain-containing protein [Caulobacteraceae bacterium]|nr:redoxin domain-containing protein [Caulobacteraceae bacterium]
MFAAMALLWAGAALAFDVGPTVGTKISSLHATNVAGEPVKLSDISGHNGIVLLFLRSAKWCPYCQRQLIDFRDAQAPLEARGYRLAAISYDPTSVLIHFAELRQIGFVISPKGIIQAKLAEEGFKVRPSVQAVLAAVYDWRADADRLLP